MLFLHASMSGTSILQFVLIDFDDRKTFTYLVTRVSEGITRVYVYMVIILEMKYFISTLLEYLKWPMFTEI